MQWPGLPGVTIDVAALLESLTPSVLTSALKAAGSGDNVAVTLQAPGLVLVLPDVLELWISRLFSPQFDMRLRVGLPAQHQ